MASARLIIEQLSACGVTHIVTLPDNASKVLLEALPAHRTIQVVDVTREGEAWAVASGLWIGGANPVVLIQNTGFLESGDALRGTAMRMGIPLLCLLTYRGYAGLKLADDAFRASPTNARLLARPDIDSCAVLFEPTLRAWGVPYEFLHDDGDIAKIRAMFDRAQSNEHPVALLVTRDTT